MGITVAIDFDGTCVTHDYPLIGKEIGAVPVLRKLVQAGHKLILNTMRGDINGDLGAAIDWFDKHRIPLYGVNKNPTQSNWTKSTKTYAKLYIDDAALGCPLKTDLALSDRPFVDWEKVEAMLIQLLVY